MGKQRYNPLLKKGFQTTLNPLETATLDGKIITPTALGSDQGTYTPTDFGICNLIRQDISTDVDISGFPPPVLGVNRMFAITNISNDKIKFKHNDGAALNAADRILLKDAADKVLKENETAIFWYDHVSQRWRVYNKVG